MNNKEHIKGDHPIDQLFFEIKKMLKTLKM